VATAYPGQPVPIVERWLGERNAPGGMILPELHNQLIAMHGTIMVFLAVVPLSVGFLHDSYASRFQRVARKPTSGTLNDRTSRTFFPS
jgi:hypothetical protein